MKICGTKVNVFNVPSLPTIGTSVCVSGSSKDLHQKSQPCYCQQHCQSSIFWSFTVWIVDCGLLHTNV